MKTSTTKHSLLNHSTNRVSPNYWVWPLLYMFFVGLYFVLRYRGQWAETDSAIASRVLRVFTSEARLVPTDGYFYPNGYAYQAISAFLLAMGGYDILTIQQIVYPLLSILIVLPAWLFLREVTKKNTTAATLGTMLLLAQPDLLFVTLRSTHEKFTRIFIFLCLFCLLKSLDAQNRPSRFVAFVALFYISAFALITSNNLLAHSFIFAILLALIFGVVLSPRLFAIPSQRSLAVYSIIPQKLMYVVAVSIGLVYLNMFYLYPPAQHNIIVLNTMWEKIASLLLDVETKAFNPYQQIESGWKSPWIYFLLTGSNIMILLLSFGIWINQSIQWIFRRRKPAESPVDWLLWLLYTSFGVQVILSIGADLGGWITSSNLQHRTLPSFSTLAVALISQTIARLMQQGKYSRTLQVSLAVFLTISSPLAVMKASLEPSMGNKWIYYQANEMIALSWSNNYLYDNEIWTDFDERLTVAFITKQDESTIHNKYIEAFRASPKTRLTLLTDVNEERSSRLKRSVPISPDSLKIYDSSGVQFYRSRPSTIFQK